MFVQLMGNSIYRLFKKLPLVNHQNLLTMLTENFQQLLTVYYIVTEQSGKKQFVNG